MKDNDIFHGDNEKLAASIEALLALDAKGALVPHGIGEHARTLLSTAVQRLATAEAGIKWEADRNALLLAELESHETPRCPGCGYTEQDCREQMDHHLCGLPEPAKPRPIRFADLPAQPQGEPVACAHGIRAPHSCDQCEAQSVVPDYWEDPNTGTCIDQWSKIQGLNGTEAYTFPLYRHAEQPAPFQFRVKPWMLECFGEAIASDQQERNHRFLEESLELVQACGCTATEAHQLVDYVYGRPVGEPSQEVGGVMVTMAALCLAHGMDMHTAGETELARIWTKVEQIRAKQAAKPAMSPLPGAYPDREQPAPVAEMSVSGNEEAKRRILEGGQRAGKSYMAAQLESLAKQVYDSWQSQPGWVPWQDGIYGSKQNEARQIASRVFELALHNRIGD